MTAIQAKSRIVPKISVFQINGRLTPNFGAGHLGGLKEIISKLSQLGIRRICIEPIHERLPRIGGIFSQTCVNALSQRIIDLAKVPEINPNTLPQINPDKVDFKSVDAIYDAQLKKAYQAFCALPKTSKRKFEFTGFCQKNSWWLDKYAYYKAVRELCIPSFADKWGKGLISMESKQAKNFIAAHKDIIEYYKFVQMEAYRQLEISLKYARSKGIEEIELIINPAIFQYSAEYLLMPELFGQAPEDKSAAIKIIKSLQDGQNAELNAYLIKSFRNLHCLGVDIIGMEGSPDTLSGHTSINLNGDLIPGKIALNATVIPAMPCQGITFTGLKEHGRLELSSDNTSLIDMLPLQTGVRKSGNKKPSYLCNLTDKITGSDVLTQLGVLAPPLNGPINLTSLSRDFIIELYKRFIGGSKAGTIALPFSSFFAFLPLKFMADPGYFLTAPRQCGSTDLGDYDLGNGKPMFLTSVFGRLDPDKIIPILETENYSFGHPSIINNPTGDKRFYAQAKTIKNESVAYLANSGKWAVWHPSHGEKLIMELAATFTSEDPIDDREISWTTYPLEGWELAPHSSYHAYDLISGKKDKLTGHSLLYSGLPVGLKRSTTRTSGEERAHFVIYKAAKGYND